MDTQDILKKVRKIEIKARGLSNNIFAGQYHSAFKGRGMAFSEVREYQYGDDIRDIDWNVSARFHKPYVKVYEEERELTVMLIIDVSGSLDVGTQKATKREVVTEIAATLHILFIIREMLDFHPESRKTDVKMAVEFLTSVLKRRCTAFLMSDFYTKNEFENALTICNRKHDVVAVQVYDPRAESLPNIGLMKVLDAETGHEMYIDTSDKRLRNAHHAYWLNRQKMLKDIFTKSNVDNVSIATNQDYVKALMQLFAMRN